MSFIKRILPIFLVVVATMTILISGASIIDQGDRKPEVEKNVPTIYDTPSAPDGYSKMNGMYHTSLTEQNTCAVEGYPVGARLSVWCGRDVNNGIYAEVIVVSNETQTGLQNTIELSKDVNDLFSGDTSLYTVWVKGVGDE